MSTDTSAGSTTSSSEREYAEHDVSAAAFWDATAEEREETFARLRAEDPVSWQRPIENAVAPDPDDTGYWAVVKHADITHVSQNADIFCSGRGVLFDELPEQFLEMTQSFMAMDNPRHNDLRKLVQKAFTPKQIKRIDDEVEKAAKEVVDDFAGEPSGEIEFVERCASQLPLRMFSAMFGVPEHLQDETATAAQEIVSWADPEHLAGRDPSQVQMEAAQKLHQIAAEIVADRKENPTDDLFTNLVQAEVDGQAMTDEEIGAFFVLLSVAGNDTTRNTIAHTAKALTDFPDQRRALAADLDGVMPTAVEEMVRFASPVLTFRRTATQDTEIRGQRIAEGDKVVMFYESGNRDTDVFGDPLSFDVTRNPNPHQGFGGGGPHFCMGNMLARTQLREIWRRLLTEVPDFEVGEPSRLTSNFVNAVKSMPITLNR